MVAALLTMVVGILGALAQSDIKRLLSFTLVSHIGYMVFGLAMSSVAGLGAAVFYVAHHITIQTSLFLVTGLIERRGGSSSVDRLAGLAKLSPVLALLFFVPAMNLAGIPPFSGFLGKVGLMQAGVELGTPLAYALVIGGVLTSLLTLLAVARVWNRAFWRKPSDAEHPDPVLLAEPGIRPPGDRAGRKQRHPAAPDHGGFHPGPGASSASSLTVFAGPLFRVSDQAAHEMLDRTSYIQAVLGEDAPVPALAQPARAGPAGDQPAGGRTQMSRKRISLRQELPLLVWLVIVWAALWQNFSPGNLLFGALIAVLVARMFYLPPVELGGRFNMLRAIPFAPAFPDQSRGSELPGPVPGRGTRPQGDQRRRRRPAAEPLRPPGHRHGPRDLADPRVTGGGGGPLHVHALHSRHQRPQRRGRRAAAPGRPQH